MYTQIPQSILQNSTPSELHNLLTTDRLIIKRQLGSFEGKNKYDFCQLIKIGILVIMLYYYMINY